MLSDEEKEKIELEFQYALDNIVSKIKGETATAIVHSEQSMILLFKRLMLKIEKQSKEIEELKNADLTTIYLSGVYDGEKKVEDKIKAKIEELENEKEKYFEKQVIQHEIDVLQSLLEKEE